MKWSLGVVAAFLIGGVAVGAQQVVPITREKIIYMEDNAFKGDAGNRVVVKAGTVVRWVHRDGNNWKHEHAVVWDTWPGSRPSDGPHQHPGDIWSRLLTEPGTYTYHCLYHPFMRGEVVVEQ